jgi:multisubunit Na+/H+ antiporter MnhF subunit
MHDVVYHVATAWAGVLLGAVLLALVRARSPYLRILAVDTMVLYVVALLLLLAVGEDAGVFVDAAIALALLGFTTTIALVRIERERSRQG